MQYKKDVQHVFLVGAKSLGAYGCLLYTSDAADEQLYV